MISSTELRKRIGIHPLEYYIYCRQLCWLGNLSRMNFSRLPRRMLSCWIPNRRPVGRPRFTYGETIKKALQKFGFNADKIGITWHTLASKSCIWKSLLCPGNFYNGISPSDATSALTRGNRLLRKCTKSDLQYRKPREPAEYISIPCMDIGFQSLVVANAWVRGKNTSNPKVNLDMNGDFGFRIFGNPQAQTWFSDAIEASILGKSHPALIR
jgi:hypothetical protein